MFSFNAGLDVDKDDDDDDDDDDKDDDEGNDLNAGFEALLLDPIR